jgi:hypothetical protein
MRTFLKISSLLVVAAVVILLAVGLWRSGIFLDAPQTPAYPTAHLTEPVLREISASAGWQSTGVLVRPGETIRFQYMSGEIRDADSVIRGPAGAGYTCGDSTCCEPVPDAPRAALIGRVGDHLFPIGDRSAIEAQEAGELQLRVNDCDSGLFDNSGSLQMKIAP